MSSLNQVRGIAMPVESIHHLVACAYILMWVFIGHVTMGRRTATESDTVHRRCG